MRCARARERKVGEGREDACSLSAASASATFASATFASATFASATFASATFASATFASIASLAARAQNPMRAPISIRRGAAADVARPKNGDAITPLKFSAFVWLSALYACA